MAARREGTRVACTSGRAGLRAEALKQLASLEARAKDTYTPPSSFAAVYNGLGDKDEAFRWLNKAFEERSPSIRGLRTEAIFDELRSDPRFDQLLERAGQTK